MPSALLFEEEGVAEGKTIESPHLQENSIVSVMKIMVKSSLVFLALPVKVSVRFRDLFVAAP